MLYNKKIAEEKRVAHSKREGTGRKGSLDRC
jgi:hypothetical protein